MLLIMIIFLMLGIWSRKSL